MKTIVSLPEEVVREAKAVSGKRRADQAVSSAIHDYVRLRKRLNLLDDLFDHPVPHRQSQIKAARRVR